MRLKGGVWVLADYGLVRRPTRISDSLTKTGARFGTPHFTAPEVHHDPRSATPAADAYSLGAIASWFTLIPPDRDVSSVRAEYWTELIRHTLIFDPNERWSLSRIVQHLERPLPVGRDRILVPTGGDGLPCGRCRAFGAVDGAGRCVHCGFQDEL
jgi:serine/threonine protein kinase